MFILAYNDNDIVQYQNKVLPYLKSSHLTG